MQKRWGNKVIWKGRRPEEKTNFLLSSSGEINKIKICKK